MAGESSKTASGTRTAAPFQYSPAKSEGPVRATKAMPAPREAAASPADRPSESAPGSYEQGVTEGESRARDAYEKSLAEARSQISLALRQFTTQREQYFERVEGDVVQLALSIARKILHRESQIDPLLLTGVVRVALEGISRDTQVRLRVNPDEVRFWRDYFTHTEGIRPSPDLIGDPSLAVGHCVLETELGSTQISFETQLKEIEQGFLDLLGQRPRVAE
jgi:flagellar assembly protein FliH